MNDDETASVLCRRKIGRTPASPPDIAMAKRSKDPKSILAQSLAANAVQAMTKAGLSPMEIAIGLAGQVNKQVDLAMPTTATVAMCKALLMIR
jgi:hypothetical protein